MEFGNGGIFMILPSHCSKDNIGPLEGVKVLDLTRHPPGDFCTMILADYGAEVLKVEDLDGGDTTRWSLPKGKKFAASYLALNRNKKSMRLNLKEKEGTEIFKKLAKDYQVIVEGFRPGVTERLGIDFESIKKINPSIIYCSITGYGQEGPYKKKVGHDINYIGIGGILEITGKKGGPPTVPGVQIADINAALMATIGILMSVIHFNKTGRGQQIDISMLDGILFWLGMIVSKYSMDKKTPERENILLNGKHLCYRVYRTMDDRYITIGAIEKKFWVNFCKGICRDDLIEHQFTDIHGRKELLEEVEGIFLTKTLKEWLACFEGLEVCHGPVNNLQEVLSDPHILFRNMVIKAEHPIEGEYSCVGFPIKLSNGQPKLRSHAPDYGENTEEVLKSIGYGEGHICDFRNRGII
jgi:crotonobetainyl-CoA:carnitine CoA-transferase CaiB-like acyl-CoA transferase